MVVHHRHRGLRHRDDALQHLGDHAHRRVAQCDSTHQACRGGQVRDNREHADRKPWPERLTRCGCAAGSSCSAAWRARLRHTAADNFIIARADLERARRASRSHSAASCKHSSRDFALFIAACPWGRARNVGLAIRPHGWCPHRLLARHRIWSQVL